MEDDIMRDEEDSCKSDLNRDRLNQIFGESRLDKAKKPSKPGVSQIKFANVEFEKFDPRIIQETIRENMDHNDDMDNVFDGSLSEGGAERIIISQNNQMFDTLNLWIGNCNVDITMPIANGIEKISGVETLEFISRYRFRMGIGKLFNEDEVKSKVAQAIKELSERKRQKLGLYPSI